MNYKIVKDWETKSGLRAVVALVSPSYPHYCGYVFIPKEHPGYDRPYYEFFDEDKSKYNQEYMDIMNQINNINVHGGLTYAEKSTEDKEYPGKSDIEGQWFGFDAAHAGDGKDWESGKILIETDEEREAVRVSKEISYEYPIATDTIKTKEYMIEQCELLAKQLKNIKA